MPTTDRRLTTHNSFAALDFNYGILMKMKRSGIILLGTTVIPGDGPLPYANGERAYEVSDKGTGRVLTRAQVVTLTQERCLMAELAKKGTKS